MSSLAPDIDFTRAAELGNRLVDQLDQLRDVSPIAWSERHKAWIVTGYDQVRDGFSGKLPLSINRMPRLYTFIAKEDREQRIPTVMETLPRMVLSQDPPGQARLRLLLVKAFSRKVTESMRDYAREVIQEVLDAAQAKGEIDYVEDVARAVPSRVILRLMGLSDDYIPRLRFWAWASNAGLGGGGTTLDILDETEKAFKEMEAAFLREIADRRANPRDDFITALIEADLNGDRLTDAEIVATCNMAVVAGHDTTGNTIGLSSVALANNPDQWDFFRDHPDRALQGTTELQRHVAMTLSQGRVVVEDFDWDGHKLAKDDIVYLVIASANRDPAVFADPARLDLERPQAELDKSMSFAPGIHHCIGHLLAKMQLTEFFVALSTRFEGIDILEDHPAWTPNVGHRGLLSLKARLRART